jgi:hypothetical protein
VRRIALGVLALALLGAAVLLGQRWLSVGASAPAAGASLSLVTPAAGAPADRDVYLDDCRRRILSSEAEPVLSGAPEFEARRHAILGRARGEPVLWVREPAASSAPSTPVAEQHPWRAIRGLLQRLSRERTTLRRLVLRERYVYSSDPETALALVTLLELPKLFDEPEIVLERGAARHRLLLSAGKRPVYRHADGPLAGSRAELLLGDRVAVDESELDDPAHRDVATWSRDNGVDRLEARRITSRTILATARFGPLAADVLLETQGARVELGCIDAPLAVRRRIAHHQEAQAGRHRALARLRDAVTAQVAEGLPFDRPRAEPSSDRDGQLRPEWRWAYQSGLSWFRFDDETYPVFDIAGRPQPPQVCMDFVLDSYERAAGSWFAERGRKPARAMGRLDFDSFEIDNRRGVLAFEKFAAERTELFDVQRYAAAERIAFRERARFFEFLRASAGLLPGDIVAIQGLKSDGKVHQHAILVEALDPLTGFPHGLADQMRLPRRRTWETIMAEAPLRSLLFRARPKAPILDAVAAL